MQKKKHQKRSKERANTSLLLSRCHRVGGVRWYFNMTARLYRLQYKPERRGGQCLKVGGQVSGAALPVDLQMQPVDGVERVGQARLQLQLGQKGEVVRGDVGVGTAGDVVVDEPLAVLRSQQAQDAHVGLGEEDVVDHPLPTNTAH